MTSDEKKKLNEIKAVYRRDLRADALDYAIKNGNGQSSDQILHDANKFYHWVLNGKTVK